MPIYAKRPISIVPINRASSSGVTKATSSRACPVCDPTFLGRLQRFLRRLVAELVRILVCALIAYSTKVATVIGFTPDGSPVGPWRQTVGLPLSANDSETTMPAL